MTDFATTHRGLDALQARRKTTIRISALALLPIMTFTTGWAAKGSWYRETLEGAGLILVGAGILGRAWSTLYIVGRKTRELVTGGPYSINRNPLYLFAFIAVAGLGAQTGSIILAGVAALGAYLIFLPVVRHEERGLGEAMGRTETCPKPRLQSRVSVGWRHQAAARRPGPNPSALLAWSPRKIIGLLVKRICMLAERQFHNRFEIAAVQRSVLFPHALQCHSLPEVGKNVVQRDDRGTKDPTSAAHQPVRGDEVSEDRM